MKKPRVRFWIILLCAALVTGCAGLNKKIDRKIETEGREYTGVPVNVDSVKLNPLTGNGKIKGTRIANPTGYSTENAIEMQRLQLNLGVLSLLTKRQPLIIDELVIDGSLINMEMAPHGGSNLKEIKDNITDKLAAIAAKKKESKKDKKKPRKMRISKLIIKNVAYHLQKKDGKIKTGTLPDIELTDVGGVEGKTIGGIGTAVVAAMTKEMFKEELFSKLRVELEGLGPRDTGEIEALIADQAAAALGQKLTLTREQREVLRIVFEIALATLNQTFAQNSGIGLLDADPLSHQFEAVSKAIRVRLKEDLEPEQLAEINAFFKEMAAEFAEMIRAQLFDRLSRFLELTPAQIEQFRPIFREELDKWLLLFKRFLDTYNQLTNDFTVLRKETSQRFEGLLRPDQIKALNEREDALGGMIRLFLSPQQ